jgi:hypothetical protein
MASLPMLAGIASTVIFASSVLPMLAKARRTRDLASYSVGNILLANLGNAVHSVYVFSLPPGPIWVLHSFYLVSSGLMLGWLVRYGGAAGLHRMTHTGSAEDGTSARSNPPARAPSVAAH